MYYWDIFLRPVDCLCEFRQYLHAAFLEIVFKRVHSIRMLKLTLLFRTILSQTVEN